MWKCECFVIILVRAVAFSFINKFKLVVAKRSVESAVDNRFAECKWSDDSKITLSFMLLLLYCMQSEAALLSDECRGLVGLHKIK